ncbi:hypothetical protein ABPG75_005747 [Micractinium tetrahymenae]
MRSSLRRRRAGGTVRELNTNPKVEHLPQHVRASLLLEQQLHGVLEWASDGEREPNSTAAGSSSDDVEAALLAELRRFNQSAPRQHRSDAGGPAAAAAEPAVQAAPEGATVAEGEPLVAFLASNIRQNPGRGHAAAASMQLAASCPGTALMLVAACAATSLLCCAVLLVDVGAW